MIKNDVTAILIKIVMTPQILPSELEMITSCIFIPIKNYYDISRIHKNSTMSCNHVIITHAVFSSSQKQRNNYAAIDQY